MSLLIAFVLILIIACATSGERAATVRGNIERGKRDRSNEEWLRLYTDPELEKTIKQAMSKEKNREQVYGEVKKAFSTTQYWKYEDVDSYILDYDKIPYARKTKKYKQMFEAIGRNRDTVLDIMLANRGKVSQWAADWGYTAYTREDPDQRALNEKYYEYCEMLKNLLSQAGVELDLYFARGMGRSGYFWKGISSQGSNLDTKLQFDKDTLFKYRENDIPPIKTNKSK